MYSYNEFLMNILGDLNTMLCPIENNSNTIELTVHTFVIGSVLIEKLEKFWQDSSQIFLFYSLFVCLPF